MAVLVGRKAPAFSCQAVHGEQVIDNFDLNHCENKNILLFFYPLDFTFVCPTELHAFQERLHAFEERGTQVIGCSVDSPYTHLAWLATPKEKGGIQGVQYPLLADLNKEIARSYGVLLEDSGVALRGLFLIDRNRIVRHQLVNDLPLGRSVDEALRILDALSDFEKYGEVCPANWKAGEKRMKPTTAGVREYFQ